MSIPYAVLFLWTIVSRRKWNKTYVYELKADMSQNPPKNKHNWTLPVQDMLDKDTHGATPKSPVYLGPDSYYTSFK